jgi:hypothetical protein
MDIFTILVFFLMVNSTSDVQVLNHNEDIVLPISTAKKIPEDALVIVISSTDILISGRYVIGLNEFKFSILETEPALQKELRHQKNKASSTLQDGENLSVILVADRDLSFHVLKKIIMNCVEAGYELIAFSVAT